MHHLLKNELNNDDPGVQSEILIFNPLTCKNEQLWAPGQPGAHTRVNQPSVHKFVEV